MPLNKDVCRYCIDRNKEWSTHRNRVWNGNDESRWKIDTVACGFATERNISNILGKPPEWCKFVLEHTVSNIMEKVE